MRVDYGLLLSRLGPVGREVSGELTFQYFAAALSGRVAALVQQDEPGG